MNLKSTEEGRIYYFACATLWYLTSFHEYLLEANTHGDYRTLKLDDWFLSQESLANWLLSASWFYFDMENLVKEEKQLLMSLAENIGDKMVIYYADEHNNCASEFHQNYPKISNLRWMHYAYCQFFLHVLSEFGKIVKKSEKKSAAYEIYQNQFEEFEPIIKEIENKRPLVIGNGDTNLKTTWQEMDLNAKRLASEWHQVVFAAAKNQQMPDFIEQKN